MNIQDKSIPLTLREQSEEWYDKEMEDSMCKELNDEREVGKLKAYGIGNHLIAMGAKRCDIPIEIDGREILVSAEFKPIRVPNEVCPDYANSRYGERFGVDWKYEKDIAVRPEGQKLDSCSCGYPDPTPCADPACEISTANETVKPEGRT